MNIYSLLNSYKWFKESYYEMAKDELAIICGNELVMQRKINLSIVKSNQGKVSEAAVESA